MIGFRHATRNKARELKINGLVRNQRDGMVYIEAEGEEDNLKSFLEWCHHGPDWAIVTNIEYEYLDKLDNFQFFSIKF